MVMVPFTTKLINTFHVSPPLIYLNQAKHIIGANVVLTVRLKSDYLGKHIKLLNFKTNQGRGKPREFINHQQWVKSDKQERRTLVIREISSYRGNRSQAGDITNNGNTTTQKQTICPSRAENS